MMSRLQAIMLISLIALPAIVTVRAAQDNADYFKISVVDEETGRGVPLLELKTTHQVRYYTDSNGIIAFYEPGLMDQAVYFHIKSHGYEFPQDFFGNRGMALKVSKGGSAVIKIKRTNIAERLYRMTGEGIYRDSILVGYPVPTRRPLLNGQVTGQDTVIAAPYRGKVYWFWGDTNKLSYPLGNFAVSGATSELPGKGGLDPSVGVDLTYFVDESGFSKAMCPIPVPGLKWLEGLMTVRDEAGAERLVVRYASMKDLDYAYEWGLAIFNDKKEVFERLVRFDLHGPHRSAHPFRAVVDGQEYYYIFPNLRVKADIRFLKDLGAYLTFTPLKTGSRYNKSRLTLDRDSRGRLHYAWKPGADPIYQKEQRELINAGLLKPEEAWLCLHDSESGAPVAAGPGSVFWNNYRRRWVMIAEQSGQVWYAEGDTPLGPWVYARKIVTHDRYTFYNPTQHPFFDQDGGRIIYFEGTYTAAWSGNPEKTPRYDYNQIMYRLKLDDPRLVLPAPVYRVTGADSTIRYLMRESIESQDSWDRIVEVAFFAIAPDRKREGLIPIYAATEKGGVVFQRESPTGKGNSDRPLFYALPAALAPPTVLLAGTWRCRLKAADGSILPFTLELMLDGEQVTGTAEQGVITQGGFKHDKLELNVKEGDNTYTLTATLNQGKLTGSWKQHNIGESGTWEGESAGSARQEARSPAAVPLYEYRRAKDTGRFYSTRPDLRDIALSRSAEPLCRVWRNPMSVLILDRKAKPVAIQ